MTLATRQLVSAYAARDGWTAWDGRRVAQCQICAETRPVQQLRAVPSGRRLLLAAHGPSVIVCRKCQRYLEATA